MEATEQEKNALRSKLILNIRIRSRYNWIGILTIANGILVVTKTPLYFPSAINTGRFLTLQFIYRDPNRINIYLISCLLFGAAYLLLGFLVKKNQQKFNRGLYIVGIGFYVLDVLPIIYMIFAYTNPIYSLIDLIFHGWVLYTLAKAFTAAGYGKKFRVKLKF